MCLIVHFQVLRQFDADAQAIERELRLARAEIEAQELDFEEYQQVVAYSRNEGLFFKNLYPAPKPASLRLQSAALSKSSAKEVSQTSSGFCCRHHSGCNWKMLLRI